MKPNGSDITKIGNKKKKDLKTQVINTHVAMKLLKITSNSYTPETSHCSAKIDTFIEQLAYLNIRTCKDLAFARVIAFVGL